MFDELSQWRGLCGSVSDKGHFPDWNAANTSTLTPYGYPYGSLTSGYVAPQLDVTVNSTSYKYNSGDDTMEYETINNKGKVKIKKLSNGFYIDNVVENYNDSGEIAFSATTYSTKTYSGVTIIPGNDYTDGKFEKHFKYIVKKPGCSKAEINALIGFELKTAPCQKQKLFPHQGICELDNGFISFACNPEINKEIEKYIPLSILKRKPLAGFVSEDQVRENWRRIFNQQPVLCFLSNWYIMGLMQYFLNHAGVFIRDFPCIKTSNMEMGLNEEKLTALLSTNNFHKYTVTTLDSGANAIEQAYSEIYDGIFLVKDQSFVDEENKIIDGIKTIIRCIRNNKISGNGRNLPMIISHNAGYIAAKLAPENAIIIDTEGIELDSTAEEIERTVDEMTSLVLNTAMSDPMEIKVFFAQKAHQIRQTLSGYATGDRLNVIIGMITVELFLKSFLGIGRYNSKLHEQYLNFINSKGEMVMNTNTKIKIEFAAKLSEKFRSKAFKAVNKARDIRFDDDGRTGVISGNRLSVSSAMITTVVNDMTSIKSSKSLIEAFKADGGLICTDGLTHPFDSHDSTGKYQRLYFYDFPADILDGDVLYTLQNPETAAFLLTKEERQLPGFMPIISDKSGNIAGKRFIYNETENDNIALYGQSGEGKSYTKAQIAASRFALGYDILVFDTSDSDTYEAMCANLTKKFVDENIDFHKLDDGEFHVNIFDIDRTASLPSKKKEVVGIITAAVGDMSVSHTNALRSVISDLLEKTDVDKQISTDDLLKLLHREGATYASLRNRLEPIIEDIKAYKLTKGTWKDFFDDTHKIHVFQINVGFSENGNQIVDALLAGLFNYKRESIQRPLSVFIDEVQNHNMSVTSPIRKILKEGRKHHLSIVSATQDFYARSTEIGSALGKAGLQIHHRPTQDSTNLVAAELRWNKADMARFDSMNRGDVIIKGTLYNKKLNRNVQTILEGHIYPFTVDDYIDNEDEKLKNGN